MKELALLLSRLDTEIVQKSYYFCLTHDLEALALQVICTGVVKGHSTQGPKISLKPQTWCFLKSGMGSVAAMHRWQLTKWKFMN